MKTFRFDFMRWRYLATGLSATLVLLSVLGLAIRGLELGIEFTGGALFDVHFPQPVAPDQVRAALASKGLTSALVQGAGSEQDVVIRMPTTGYANMGELTERLVDGLNDVHADASIVNSEVIGPALGEELRDSAGLGALASFAVVGIYIMFRFAGKFAIGATVALIHDVVITLGAFIALGLTFDMPAFAAILAIIGYSLNDTIVVYDRVRENLRGMRTASVTEAINRSLNQTLGRTVAMSATTLFTVLALLLLGGEALRSFAAAMTVGVVVGTFSSIYVASSLLLTMRFDRRSLLPAELEPGAERP
ncbi:MAG: protein translocase subunit SecF [Pseudomonadales bacterium]